MRNFVRFLLVLLLWGAANMRAGAQLDIPSMSAGRQATCAQSKSCLEKIFSTDPKPLAEVFKGISLTSTKVLLLGEHHTVMTGKMGGYEYVLEDLQKSGFVPDCVAIEVDPNNPPKVCQFAKVLNESNGQSAVSRAKSIEAYLQPPYWPYSWYDVEQLIRYVARHPEKKISLQCIDTKHRLRDPAYSYSESTDMKNRNEHMAGILSSLLKGGTCKKIMTINGMNHLSDGYDEIPVKNGETKKGFEKYTSIRTILKDKHKIEAKAINLFPIENEDNDLLDQCGIHLKQPKGERVGFPLTKKDAPSYCPFAWESLTNSADGNLFYYDAVIPILSRY